jgi:hypothetical protein
LIVVVTAVLIVIARSGLDAYQQRAVADAKSTQLLGD